ncbi:MAG: hypothetical protein SFV15_15835 [Polyangiaceae bacterium]|nr:hypothetical protein [Polyangiaceae bacterium]
MSTIRILLSMTTLSTVLVSASAFAQNADGDNLNPDGTGNSQGTNQPGQEEPANGVKLGVGTEPQALPPPQSDNDAQPQVAAPAVAAQGITEQAGVGGTQAYGRAGVLELGGFANLTNATDYLSIGFNPTIGWFFMDNVEISAILGVNYSKQTTVRTPATATTAAVTEDTSGTNISLLAEPSLHIPLSKTLFGFLGVGFGISSQSVDPGPDAGTGFAMAPRLGMNVLVGRSGVFTPAIQGTFQTTDAVRTPQGTILAVSSSVGVNAGYTVMW